MVITWYTKSQIKVKREVLKLQSCSVFSTREQVANALVRRREALLLTLLEREIDRDFGNALPGSLASADVHADGSQALSLWAS
jgi:hypothetical protein